MSQFVARFGHRTLTVVCAALLGCGLIAANATARPTAAGARPTSTAAKPTRRAAPRLTPSTPVTPGSDYLALGDSVTFGFQEPQVVPAPNYFDAASFRAYPEMLGSQLHLRVANLACPGETSASLLNAKAQSNDCENGVKGARAYRRYFPLHVKYSGSQIAYAVRYLKTHPATRLVSLLIGANDVFLCEKLTADSCLSPIEQLAVLARITRNVRTTLRDIRQTAGYHGQLVIVDYYSTDYASPFANAVARGINGAEAAGAKGFSVRFANAYASFAAAARHSGSDPCTAGLLTQLGAPGNCGIHPSFVGQTLLAATVGNAIRIR